MLNAKISIIPDDTGKTVPTRQDIQNEYGIRFGDIKLELAYNPKGDVLPGDKFVAVYVKERKKN